MLIVPLIGGSGAAGPDGNPGIGGDGSGGAIRLVAPTGGGNGSHTAASSSEGGAGRVRIDTTDPLAFRNLVFEGSVTRGTRMFTLPAPIRRSTLCPRPASPSRSARPTR